MWRLIPVLQALDKLVRDGNAAGVQECLAATGTVGLEYRNRKGRLPLHQAVLDRHVDVVRALLEGGALLDARDSAGLAVWHVVEDMMTRYQEQIQEEEDIARSGQDLQEVLLHKKVALMATKQLQEASSVSELLLLHGVDTEAPRPEPGFGGNARRG